MVGEVEEKGAIPITHACFKKSLFEGFLWKVTANFCEEEKKLNIMSGWCVWFVWNAV